MTYIKKRPLSRVMLVWLVDKLTPLWRLTYRTATMRVSLGSSRLSLRRKGLRQHT